MPPITFLVPGDPTGTPHVLLPDPKADCPVCAPGAPDAPFADATDAADATNATNDPPDSPDSACPICDGTGTVSVSYYTLVAVLPTSPDFFTAPAAFN